MKNEPVFIERELNAPIEKVWSAITNKDEMNQWYFNFKEFKPEAGFEFQFYAGPKGNQYLHLCRITEVVQGNKLVYSWRYDGYEGNSIVTFELFPVGDKTKIRLTHEGLDSFPAKPDFARENFAMGWTEIIGTSLKDYVEKANV